MGAANIAVVERCIEAIGAHDAATLLELSRDDVEVIPLRAALEDVVYRGSDGIRQWIADIGESWQDLRIDVEDTAEVAPDIVLSRGTFHARGHASDAPTTMPVTLVCWLRDG